MDSQVQTLYEKVTQHPTRFAAWEAAVEMAGMDISNLQSELIAGLRAKDEFTRECCLEVLVQKNNEEIIKELKSVFQDGPRTHTGCVESISRLREHSQLPKGFYEDIDKSTRTSRRRYLQNPLCLIDAIPNIFFPEEKVGPAGEFIKQAVADRSFFLELDIVSAHELFYPEQDNPVNGRYRKIKLWDFDYGGSPVELFGQPFVGPASIQPTLYSLVKKIRQYSRESRKELHPVQFIGETFFQLNLIHPFYDCNGRTNFLLMNIFLLQQGLPYAKMQSQDLPEYYNALNSSVPTDFVEFLGKLITKE